MMRDILRVVLAALLAMGTVLYLTLRVLHARRLARRNPAAIRLERIRRLRTKYDHLRYTRR